MKMIDEKGRLFGKVNAIDFLAILFLFCLMPAFYFGYKIMTRKPVVVKPKKEIVVIEINCRLIKLRPEVLKLISVGDKELDENGQVRGEIISLGESMPYEYEIDIGKGQKIIKEDSILKQVEARFKLKAEVKQDNIYYKDKAIKIGWPLEFKTNKYSLIVIVIVPKEEKMAEEALIVELKLIAKFKNLIPEMSKVIKRGDKQIEIVGPNIKRILAKIARIVSDEPAEYISLIPGKRAWSIVGHPKNRDIVLEIEAFCTRRPKGLFLKNKAIKIGGPFKFSTDLYAISGTIIGIETK